MTDQSVKGHIQNIGERSFTVLLNSDEACHSCGLSSVCSDKRIEFEKDKTPFKPVVGQKVEVEYEKLLQTSFIVYIVPLLFFFLGIIISGQIMTEAGELGQFAGAVFGTAVGLGLVALLNKRLTNSKYKVNIRAI